MPENFVLFDRMDHKRALEALIGRLHEGVSGALVVHGEAGMGKTVLVDYATSLWDGAITRIAGVESEQSFGFAALHRLLLPFLGEIVLLPAAQRTALESAFGLVEHDPPDRYMVGLAALGLLALVGSKSGALCVVDDAQWIDTESLQALAFVGRRLQAEGVALLFGLRTHLGVPPDLSGIADMEVAGLPLDAATGLLNHSAARALPQGLVDKIFTETSGCPLALRELGSELADDPRPFRTVRGETLSVSRRVEDHFLQQVSSLPPETRQFLLVAAAETSGDRGTVESAAGLLGVPASAEIGAVREHILTPGQRIRFRHPLIRSAVYSSAEPEQRRRAHRALSTVVGKGYPDIWAHHVVQGADGPDETLAGELEATADIARSRGGYTAQMALLTGAANLTESVDLQALRLLHAARAALNAGANERLAELLDRAEPHLSDPMAIGEALLLRGHLTVRRYQPAAAPARLFAAALQFLPYDTVECRAALLETFDAYAISQHFTTEISGSDIVRIARELETASADHSLEELLLQGSARLLEDGPCAAAQHFQAAADVFRNGTVAPEQLATRFTFGYVVANELLDAETHARWSERVDAYARENGALTVLLFNLLAQVEDRLRLGRIDAATACYEEALDVASAMGFPAEYYEALNVPILAWKGDEAGTLAAAESLIGLASAVGVAATIALAQQALATLHVSQSRYHQALQATDYIHDREAIGYTSKVLGYAVEAAVGVGNLMRAEELAAELDRRAKIIGGPWLGGLNARSRALMAQSDRAEEYFALSIKTLERSVVVTELAHTRLLYGEWLRRNNRRIDARVQLQMAHDFFASIGAEGFAERASQALLASGARVGPRTPRKTLDLTPQELRVAQLAAERLTNAEIAAQLFISAATVDYHLRKVYRKLNIESRRQLAEALHNEG